jgi:hypothetical protein
VPDPRRSSPTGQVTATQSDPGAPGQAPGEGQGGAAGKQPGTGYQFSPLSADPTRQAEVGRGSGGRSRGGANRDATPREPNEDPTERSAVLRLQQAIRRIEASRARRLPGAGVGQGDPANQTRGRDW